MLNSGIRNLPLLMYCQGYHRVIILGQLFTILVRPILEYGSVIWDPKYTVHSGKIESVQIQFLLFCRRRLGNGWDPNKRL